KIKPAPQQPNIHELASKKGVVGLAVDLISYDPKFKDVFSYVFGNTLIVEDVETARKIGIGNARMVTLEGDVLETTGAMIGGFRTKRAGNFKEKSLSDTISKLNKEEANLKKQEEELHNLKLENDNDVWMLKSKKVTLEGEITTLERSIGIASNLSEIEKNKDQMAEQLRSIESQIKQSQSKADSHNADMQKLKEQRSQIREKLKQPEIAAGFESIDQKKQSISMGLIESRSEIKRLNEMIESHHKVEMKKLQEIIGVHEKEQKSFEEEINTLTGGLKSKGSDLKSKQSDEQKFFKELQAMYDKKAKLTEVIRKHETQLAREEEIVNSLNYKINQSTLDNAKLSGDMAGLNEQFKEFADAKIRRGIELSQLEYEMKQFDRMMKDMGNVNLRALEVYDEVSKKHQEVLEKKEKLKIEKEDVLNMMHEIDGKKQYSFMKTFKVLQQNFQQCYSQLTAKGEAFLEIENKENVFEGGVDIKVRLIGNRYLDIKSLSGGEKTLAALAFIFAIQEFNPASFYLLDEVDAALDKRNSELLSNLIKKYSDKAQYIVISHNDHVITEADLLYGVSMQDGVSKVVTLKV
ncbi:chromosome segregation protein SMC, partial [Candidatus Woesearchaeota archaeon]|nr:chromosome segregation protein SMC [Candidatus Woesearchaeota archaeon]